MPALCQQHLPDLPEDWCPPGGRRWGAPWRPTPALRRLSGLELMRLAKRALEQHARRARELVAPDYEVAAVAWLAPLADRQARSRGAGERRDSLAQGRFMMADA
jgi:hypothetical protein